MRYEELTIEGRNAVLEAFRSGKTIDKLFVLDGCQDGPVRTIVREAKKHDAIVNFVARERLDCLYDPQTAGGLLLSVAEDRAEELLRRLADSGVTAAAIGRVLPRGDKWLRITP